MSHSVFSKYSIAVGGICMVVHWYQYGLSLQHKLLYTREENEGLPPSPFLLPSSLPSSPRPPTVQRQAQGPVVLVIGSNSNHCDTEHRTLTAVGSVRALSCSLLLLATTTFCTRVMKQSQILHGFTLSFENWLMFVVHISLLCLSHHQFV